VAGPPVYRYNLAVSDMMSDAGRYGYPGRPDTSTLRNGRKQCSEQPLLLGSG
jgi:hypothetical protein